MTSNVIDHKISDNNLSNKKKIPARKTVPPPLKLKLWSTYNGTSIEGKCFCCQRPITPFDFHIGHVIAHSQGGDISLENLRPICVTCNTSMGAENLFEFKARLTGTQEPRVNLVVGVVESISKDTQSTTTSLQVSNKRQYTCAICKQVSNKGRYRCYICKQVFTQQWELDTHLNDRNVPCHAFICMTKCEECGETFDRNVLWRLHLNKKISCMIAFLSKLRL